MSEITQTTTSTAWKKPFFTVWTGQAFSLMGSVLVQFALVWWLTKMTGSATILATASLVALIPEVLLGPFAGALVDRWDRRKVMIIADVTIALVTVGLVVLFWTGAVQIWHIYVAMALRALGEGFHRPAMQASTTLMVPRDQLGRIAGLNQTLMGAMNIVAPPFGALLMELLPIQGVLAVDLVTATLAVLPLLFIRIPRPEPAAAGDAAAPSGSLLADVKSGFRFVWRWPGVRYVLFLAMAVNFLINPAFRLMPLSVTQHFHGGALQLGWLDSAWGLGIVGGGLLLGVWGGFRNRVVTAMTGMALSGLGVMLMGLTPANLFPMALASLFAGAVANSICNGSFMAIMQETIPPAMQGRVFTVVGSACMAMMPIGMALAGPLADRVGVQAMYVGSGLAMALMGAGSLLVPTIVHLEKNRPTDLEEYSRIAMVEAVPVAGQD